MRRAEPWVDRRQLANAARQAVVRLDPRALARNPVMFTVGVTTALTGLLTLRAVGRGEPAGYALAVTALLLATVWFANLSDAIAEARGRAVASSLRGTRSDAVARRVRDGREEQVPATSLVPGDVVVVEAGELVPGDGEVLEGAATVDESAITGESAPVVREAGTDRSGVTGGTRVLTDRLVVRIDAATGDTFLDRMIRLVEGAERQRTPNEIALSVLLAALTLVFLLVVVTLPPIAGFVGVPVDRVTLIALFVCLIPTTIGALLPAIGIAGMDRALRANVIAKSGRAVEVCGDVDLLLLDKTGTITVGARRATRFAPVPGVDPAALAQVAAAASLDDPTPEGRSIVELAGAPAAEPGARFVPFSATTRMSGVDLPGGRALRKGAASQVIAWVTAAGGVVPPALSPLVDEVARAGGTPLVVADGARILGVVALTDVLKPGIAERFQRLRAMGIETVMITGDNPLTAAAIAAEAGVDGFLAEATPEDKLARIRLEQAAGKRVAMMGDGTNDAPALAQADVGLAMNSGTQPAKEAANLIDLDSDPTKLLEVVEIGKQLLLTRGALTTFSIANDVAKYFAILPALFVGVPGMAALERLDLMDLTSARSAILSAVAFNALVIPALVPLALRGVRIRAESADRILLGNLVVYGVGGVVAPFVGIKAIDVLLTLVGWT